MLFVSTCATQACGRWGEGEAEHPVAPANEGRHRASTKRPPVAAAGTRAQVRRLDTYLHLS